MKDKSKFTGNELKYLEMVLKNESWSSTEGNWTTRLEEEFSKKMGATYSIAANSGTATLHMALLALGIGPGDEVITPALTVIMDSSAVLHCGATPIYADVDQYDWNIDPKEVEKKITKKTKAIIAVSLYGYPVNIEELSKISQEYELAFIVDNAQHLGKHKSLITSYSFEGSKFLSCGEGGIVVTNNEELARKMRLYGNHGFSNSLAKDGKTKSNMDIYQYSNHRRHSVIGYNYRLSEFCSAIALAQLEKMDEIVENRKVIAKMFKEVIKKYSNEVEIKVQGHTFEEIPEHDYWTLAIEIGGTISSKRFIQEYRKNGGDIVRAAWLVPYEEPALIKLFGNRKGICPVAEELQKKIFQIKMNYRDLDIASKKVEALEKTLKEWK
jgi:perosamine synthetase